MAKLEELGRLLSAHTASNARPAHVDDIQAALQPVDDMTGSFCHVAETNYYLSDSDSDAANEMLNLLVTSYQDTTCESPPGWYPLNRTESLFSICSSSN